MSNAQTIQGSGRGARSTAQEALLQRCLPRNLRHEDLAARRLVVAPGRATTGMILNATTSTDTRRGLRASAPGDGDNEALLFQRSTLL
jgi:hypothetical protein